MNWVQNIYVVLLLRPPQSAFQIDAPVQTWLLRSLLPQGIW